MTKPGFGIEVLRRAGGALATPGSTFTVVDVINTESRTVALEYLASHWPSVHAGETFLLRWRRSGNVTMARAIRDGVRFEAE